ncbi:MAG: HNH endonuclease signature motif containing protein, partial [Gammaproteobacteria bacterium]|nr:HNH endonuclease signature motif containing protein [Gammaproteobacteria bacterium]
MHHVKHWTDGGETSPENLISLCSAHHRMVHEEGFKIKKDFQGAWYFQRPDGRPIPQGPIYTTDDNPQDVSAETIPTDIPGFDKAPVSPETFTQVTRIEEPQVGYGQGLLRG